MKRRSERLQLDTIAGLSLVGLGCYTVVLRLCRQERVAHDPIVAERRQRMAYIAHTLDWLVNLLIGLMSYKLIVSEQVGGRYHPLWLRIYFIITGPLPTLGMLVAMITAHQQGATAADETRRRRMHTIAGFVGYAAWWLSVLPIFVRPLLRQTAKQVPQGFATEE